MIIVIIVIVRPERSSLTYVNTTFLAKDELVQKAPKLIKMRV